VLAQPRNITELPMSIKPTKLGFGINTLICLYFLPPERDEISFANSDENRLNNKAILPFYYTNFKAFCCIRVAGCTFFRYNETINSRPRSVAHRRAEGMRGKSRCLKFGMT